MLLLATIFFVSIANTTVGKTESKSNICSTNDNQAPNRPIVDGPMKIKAGVYFDLNIQTTDPDNDQIYYQVSYNPSIKSEVVVFEFGPFSSGEQQTIGDFYFISPPPTPYPASMEIIAIDEHGLTSEPAIFQVTVPKTIINSNLFIKIIELINQIFIK